MIETVYKLTRLDRTTYGGFLYEAGVTYHFPGKGQLCTPAYAHAYRTPELAVLYNPIHANYNPFLLFQAQGEVEQDDGTKLGLISITLPVVALVAPTFSSNQCVVWAITVAWPFAGPKWQGWAWEWLSGANRVAGAADAAAVGAAGAAAWAARAAVGAAGAAAWAGAAAEAAAWGAARARTRESCRQAKLATWAINATDPFVAGPLPLSGEVPWPR